MATASKMAPKVVEKVKAPTNPWEGHMGTKSSMLVPITPEEYEKRFGRERAQANQSNGLSSGELVLAKDENGEYWTPVSNVDSGLLDPFRVCYKR